MLRRYWGEWIVVYTPADDSPETRVMSLSTSARPVDSTSNRRESPRTHIKLHDGVVSSSENVGHIRSQSPLLRAWTTVRGGDNRHSTSDADCFYDACRKRVAFVSESALK